MGFLEETKVFLSTTTADRIEPGFSKIRWDLKSRIAAVNPLYKMKLKCVNANIPETFARVSEDLGNNKMVLVYSNSPITSPEQIRKLVKEEEYVQITVPPQHLAQEAVFLSTINHCIISQMADLIFEEKPALYVRRGINTAYMEIGFTVINYNANLLNINMDFPGIDVPDGAQFMSFEQTQLKYSNPPYFYKGGDNAQMFPTAGMYYKLLTEADIPGTGFTPEDVGLSRVLGFSRINSYPTFSMTRIATGVLIKSVNLDAVTPIDMSGTRFISIVVPDMGINNIEPDTKSSGRTIACLPVSPGSFNSTVVVPGIQDNPYITIPQDVINNFQVELRNDRGKPLKVDHDWFIEFNVRIEEPEKIDIYRGTDDLPRLPVSKYDGYDEGEYEKANLETVRYVNNAERDEMRQRERFTKKHRV